MGSGGEITNAQCPIAQLPNCPIAQLPNAQCPFTLIYVPDAKFSAATAHFPLEITNCKGK
ncbi:MAG: hypothetical protein V7L04_04245 [Nostoc sp.]|uniref:hypothetical protein n=1 Tax=Nostoc sp. TaxID=1180 RepID=UPI002FFB2DC8